MSKDKDYKAKMIEAIPIIHHKKDDEHWVARTSAMPIYGTGTTPEEAEQDLMDYLLDLVPLLYSRRHNLCRKLKEHLEILLRYFEVKEGRMSDDCKLFCQGCGIPAPSGGPSCDICKTDTWKSFARPNTPETPNLLLRIEELERRLKKLEEAE